MNAEAADEDAGATRRLVDEALQARTGTLEALATRLADREEKVGRREDLAWLREDPQRAFEEALAVLGLQNSELRQANEKLVLVTLTAQELREAAQMVSRRQDEFLAMLAHELRNPLAPISNAVELLSTLDGKPIPGDVLDIVRRQVKHMVRLVDDLLDASRLTQGKVTLQRRPTAVSEFVQQAVETCRDPITARQQRLTLDLPTANVFVDGDPVRLTQVFSNLLQNAAKYTPEGGEIAIQATRLDGTVEIRVRDNGAGISAAALPYVFELFAQDQRSLGRAQGGLGIGLTVVRRMVELHGGSVDAHSDGPGLGSEFVVTLPCIDRAGKRAEMTQAVAALAPTPAHVLVIDDNLDAGQILAALLRLSGHEVDVALDGPSGLERFETSRPQVVLCDIGLPGMDGYEVVRRMRESGHEPRPVVIAVTGYGGARNVDRAHEAGFDHHVVKPVDLDALLRLVDSALRVEEWSASGRGPITSHGSLRDDDRRDRPR